MSHHEIRAAIYARVSSDGQVKGNTIGSQLEALAQRVKEDGLGLETELRFIDDGYSGSTLVRPALERLRDQAAAGGFDRLYIHSPDRIARSYVYQMLLVEELGRCGVELAFLNHEIGKTPEDHLLLQMQGMMAEYERARILERGPPREAPFRPRARPGRCRHRCGPLVRLPLRQQGREQRPGRGGRSTPRRPRPSGRCSAGWASEGCSLARDQPPP